MTTIIGGKLMQVDKSALRNVVKHTDAHNRVKEMDEMWKQHEKQKYSDREDERESDRKRRSRKVYKKGMYSDSIGGPQMTRSTKAGPWTKQLMEYEEKDPDRWGHSGYKELYPEDFGAAEEPLIPHEKEETVIEEEDARDEDIVERWKKGRFRPQVDSRRPIRGFDRGRQRFGRGRGKFGGSFRRNTTENRQQEGRNDGTRRERQRSGSAEIYRTRLPGRFDRQRSRSDSRERQRRRRSRDHETRKSDVDLPTHKDTKENKGSHSYRERSRERFESKISTDESKSTAPLSTHRSDDRKIDTPKRRWDQRANSTDKGKQTKEIEDVKLRKNAPVAVEEQSQVESVAREIRGRWERDESSDEENVEANEDVNESSRVDAFGRDISKRHEYKMRQKYGGPQDSDLHPSNEKVTRYNRIDNYDNDSKAKEDDLSMATAANVINRRRKERNSIRDAELGKPGGVSDNKDDENSADEGGDKSSKVKSGRKKKHRKKVSKRSKYRESDAEDDVAGRLKDAHMTKGHHYTGEYITGRTQTNDERSGSREEVDQTAAVILDGLHAESEMRERIKLKMRQRMEGSLLKKNILTPADEMLGEMENDLHDLRERIPEKGKDRSHADEKLQEPGGISRISCINKHDGNSRLAESEKQVTERRHDSGSDSEHGGKRKSDGSRNRKQREMHSTDRETSSRKERGRRKFRDDSRSSSEEKKRKGRRNRKESFEDSSADDAKELRRTCRKDNTKDNYDKLFRHEEYTVREREKVKKGSKHRHDSYNSAETGEEKDLKSHSDTSSYSGRAKRKKASKAKRQTDKVDSRRKLGKRSTHRESRVRSDSENSSESLEEAAGTKHRHKMELDSGPWYGTKTSRISEGGKVRSVKEDLYTTKTTKKTHSSEESSTTDSGHDNDAKKVSKKVRSNEKLSKNDERKSRRKRAHKGDSSSDEESSSDAEEKSDEKKHNRGRSSRASELKRHDSREQFARRKDGRMLSEDENSKHVKRDAKEKLNERKDRRMKRNDSEESDSYSSDSSEDVRTEHQRQFKSKKNQRGGASSHEDGEDKAKLRKRQNKNSRENTLSIEYKRKEVKEDYRKRKKRGRESSDENELLTNKRRKRRSKHNESDDRYETRKSKKKHKAGDRGEKPKRRNKHSVTSSEDSDHTRMEKNLEAKDNKYEKGYIELTSNRVSAETLEKSGNLFDSRFRKGRDGDSTVDKQLSDEEEGKSAEQSIGMKDVMESRNLDKLEGYFNPATREEARYTEMSVKVHGIRDDSNVDLSRQSYSEEKQKVLNTNVVEKLEDARQIETIDPEHESKATRDNDSSSDISLYGDIDLKDVSSHGLLSKEGKEKSEKGSSRRKLTNITTRRDSPSPTDGVSEKDSVSGNTVRRKQGSRPEYNRDNRSLSPDDGSRKEKRGREMGSNGSESSNESLRGGDKFAGVKTKRTTSPVSRSRLSRDRRSKSYDSSSPEGRRKASHHRRRKTSSVSASDSSDSFEHGRAGKRSGTKGSKLRSRSHRSSSSPYSSAVDDRGRRHETQSKKRKEHTRDYYRRSRKSSEDSDASVSSVDKKKRKRR